MSAAIAALVEAKRNITISQYTSVAGLVVCFYDMFLLLPDELEFHWARKSGVSLARICYLVNRYLPPFGLIVANYHFAPFRGPLTPKVCAEWLAVVSAFELVGLTCGTVLLLLRVLALYSNHRWLKVFLWTFFGMSYVTSSALMLASINRLQNDETSYSPILEVCVVTVITRSFQVLFIITVPFELCIGGLIAYRALQNWRLYSSAKSDTGSSLVAVTVTDGSVWAWATLILKLANAAIWLFLPPSLILLGVFLTWGLSSACISRFSINLSKAAATGSGFSGSSKLSTGIGFAVPPSQGLSSTDPGTVGDISIPMEPTRREQV